MMPRTVSASARNCNDYKAYGVLGRDKNPTWGYTWIVGALKNVGHRVNRSTIARILKAHGIPPVPERPTSWQTFLRAHGGAIAGADFFTTEVWTWRGLVTHYTVFVIDLASRRVHIVGSTPHPDERFMQQVARTLTAADEGPLMGHRVLICDRDTKWSAPVRARLGEAGIPRGADAVSGTQCECVCRALRAINQRGVPGPRDPVRGNVICAGQSRSTSSITTMSGIIKGWRTNGLRARRRRTMSAAFTDVRAWAAYSTITNAPRERGGAA